MDNPEPQGQSTVNGQMELQEVSIAPCRWWRDKWDAKEGLWYLVIGDEGKETSIMPAFHAHDDFASRPQSKAIILAINSHDDLKARVVHLEAVCLAYDKTINTLRGDELVRFANAIPEEYRTFVSLLAKRSSDPNDNDSANAPMASTR
jgi:hypothetical protein